MLSLPSYVLSFSSLFHLKFSPVISNGTYNCDVCGNSFTLQQDLEKLIYRREGVKKDV